MGSVADVVNVLNAQNDKFKSEEEHDFNVICI